MFQITKNTLCTLLCASLLITSPATAYGGALSYNQIPPNGYITTQEALAQNALENAHSNESLSGNCISGNTVSQNSTQDQAVSDHTISGNTVSQNVVSQNTVSQNELAVSADTIAPAGAQSRAAIANELPKFSTCKIVHKNKVLFKTTIKNKVKSSDKYYYLAKLNPMTNKIEKIITKTKKKRTFSYKTDLTDTSGYSLLFGKYALYVKNGKKYKAITKPTYIANPEVAATYTAAFPKSTTKKGLQGRLTKGDLGVNHSLLNLRVSDIIAEGTNGVPYKYNGKTYYFKKNPMVGAIQKCNQEGITISLVILLDYRSDYAYLIPKSARKLGAAPYYAWDVKTKKSRETFEAMFSYLGELYSNKNCHLDNWILGNEFNSADAWHHAGNMKRSTQISYYAQAFRIMYYAVKSHYKNARCYISLDANWRDNGTSLGARDVMLDFDRELKTQNPKIRWNLAYHAYPIPLTQADFWNNTLPTKDPEHTRYVTPKNLSILTEFVRKNFGKSCRIILSEQGFTSTSGEAVQAAAVAYAYYVAAFDPMVDSFIMRAEYDHPVEVAQGLKLGLSTMNGYRKPAYDVFKYMDTPYYESYTASARKTLKISNWKQLVKKFTPSKLKNKIPQP